MWASPMSFAVADLNVRGELQSIEDYAYQELERIPGAAEIIGQLSGALWKSPNTFQTFLPFGNEIMFRWLASAPTCGIATIRFGEELVSVSLVASGLDPAADRITFSAFQDHLLRELHDTGFEPAFALTELSPRPLIATINFNSPPDPTDRLTAGLADRCFAASFFRYHQLA